MNTAATWSGTAMLKGKFRRILKPALTGIALTGVLLGLEWPYAALAQDKYPSKPIQLNLAFSGGMNDKIARFFGPMLESSVKQPVIIETKAGAGGLIGARFVSQAAADGYQLLLGSDSLSLAAELSNDPALRSQTELVPVAPIVAMPFVFVTSTKKPYSSLKDLIDTAKANPGKLNYATTGVGTYPHLMGEALNKEAGINIVHIPYKGGAEIAVALLAGQIDYAKLSTPIVLPYIRDGVMKPLAIATNERSPLFPDVPTVQELGYKTLGSGSSKFFIFGPKALQGSTKDQVEAAVLKVLAEPQFKNTMIEWGGLPLKGGSADVAKVIDETRVYYFNGIKEFNIKVN